MRKDSLGDRMKGYENVNRSYLIKRMPVIIRLDGKAFHTYTKNCDKPFDRDLQILREATMSYLCESIQGCIFGYAQSDEISLVLKDLDTFKTCSWFNNNLQKIVSVSASMCTATWNELATAGLSLKFDRPAIFDSRAWNLPKEEVVNYLLWRQKDWTRNSVQMLGRSYYSHNQLKGVSCKEIVTMVEQEQGVIWGELPAWQKRGSFWVRGKGIVECPIFEGIRRIQLENILNEQVHV